MPSAIFDGILAVHVIFALAWLRTLIAGIFPALRLVNANVGDPARDPAIFRRGIVLSRLVAVTGGIAVLFGLVLYYYIEFVDTTFATSPSGGALIIAGAIVGLIAFGISTYQSPKLRRGYRARIAQTGASTGTRGQMSQGGSQESKNQLPPRYLIFLIPVLVLVALVLMLAGSMM